MVLRQPGITIGFIRLAVGWMIFYGSVSVQGGPRATGGSLFAYPVFTCFV